VYPIALKSDRWGDLSMPFLTILLFIGFLSKLIFEQKKTVISF